MRVVHSIEALWEATRECRGSMGFVPTMGALHKGHLSLIQQAREQNETVVVSIFVNPTQFLEGEDLDKYPRKDEADKRICELAGVDILFMPTAEMIYEADELKIMAPAIRGFILEGQSRPGHFDGMLQVVMKLLNLMNYHHPSVLRAYFGKKDAQQLMLIEEMVRRYFMPVEIIPCDIVREPDGLALSSRNIYLSDFERQEALKLSASLKKASELVMQGTTDVFTIKSAMLEVLKPLDVAYVAVVSRQFKALDQVSLGESIILVAAKVGTTRLIDNLWI